jgi:hypothetical protein
MSAPADAVVPLFSYGTLQLPEVQRATFGRLLDGRPDALCGFALEPLVVSSAEIARISGAAVHYIARAGGDASGPIPGVVFAVTAAELAAADRYEVDARRIEAVLASGARAFVYVALD